MGKRIMAENDYNWSREIHLQAMKGSTCIIRRVDLLRRSISVSFIGYDGRGPTFITVGIMS